jgi:hypothetical protein
MIKPRTLVFIAAAGASVFLVWRWQRQRLIKFDQGLFTDNSETQKALAPGFSIQKEATAGTSKRRPIQTTVYKGEPGKHNRSPKAIYQASSNNHVDVPASAPESPVPPAAPMVADEAATASDEDVSAEAQADESTEAAPAELEPAEDERPS